MGFLDHLRPRKSTVGEMFHALSDCESEAQAELAAPRPDICGLRVEYGGTVMFVCTSPLNHGGRLHRSGGTTWDEVAKELRRGTHVPKGGE